MRAAHGLHGLLSDRRVADFDRPRAADLLVRLRTLKTAFSRLRGPLTDPGAAGLGHDGERAVGRWSGIVIRPRTQQFPLQTGWFFDRQELTAARIRYLLQGADVRPTYVDVMELCDLVLRKARPGQEELQAWLDSILPPEQAKASRASFLSGLSAGDDRLTQSRLELTPRHTFDAVVGGLCRAKLHRDLVPADASVRDPRFRAFVRLLARDWGWLEASF